MKNRVKAAVLAIALAAGGTAEAGPGHRGRPHHPHHHHRPHFAANVVRVAPLYVAPRYYFPPPARVVYVVPPAPVYIEQPQIVPPPVEAAQAWWYFCPQYRAYYPQVQSCPGPWQRVAPQPPPG